MDKEDYAIAKGVCGLSQRPDAPHQGSDLYLSRLTVCVVACAARAIIIATTVYKNNLSSVAGTRVGAPAIGTYTLASRLTDISAFKDLKLLGGHSSL
jgi:hypothetical protein